jgi:hypothetical protein
MESTQPLWKTADVKAEKRGPHHTVYWVQRNQKYLNAQRLGNRTTEEIFLVGDRYVGDWENNKKHGFGTQTWTTGDKYEGEWKAGKMFGKGTYWVKDKKLRKEYTGDWRNNRRHGLGIFYYSNGDKYEGEWYQGTRHGRGKLVYSSGDVFEGDWVDDQRSGLGVLTLANGDRYEGHWLEDKKEGPGRFFYLSTHKLYEGEWVNDVAKCGIYKDIPANQYNQEYSKASVDNFALPVLELTEPEQVVSEAVAKIRQERAQLHAGEQEIVFTPAELEQLREEFQYTDTSDSGLIKCRQLTDVLTALGMSPDPDEIDLLLRDLNADSETEISFAEFVDIMALLSTNV